MNQPKHKEKRKIVKPEDFWGESSVDRVIAIQNLLNKQFSCALNEKLYGDAPKRSWFSKLKLELRYQIANMRIRLGEWIAGEQFYD